MGKLIQATILSELQNLTPGRIITVGQMKQMGDTGLGTLQRDGHPVVSEITMIDGHAYSTLKNGITGELADDNTVYFGEFAQFTPEVEFEVEANDRDDLAAKLSSASAADGYMVRITGTFRTLTLRSVDGSATQYHSLSQIVADQRMFTGETGKSYDMVGIFTAAGLPSKVSPAGLHLHAVAGDRQEGGHLLDFKGMKGHVQIMPVDEWNLLAHCRGDGTVPEQKSLRLKDGPSPHL